MQNSSKCGGVHQYPVEEEITSLKGVCGQFVSEHQLCIVRDLVFEEFANHEGWRGKFSPVLAHSDPLKTLRKVPGFLWA